MNLPNIDILNLVKIHKTILISSVFAFFPPRKKVLIRRKDVRLNVMANLTQATEMSGALRVIRTLYIS